MSAETSSSCVDTKTSPGDSHPQKSGSSLMFPSPGQTSAPSMQDSLTVATPSSSTIEPLALDHTIERSTEIVDLGNASGAAAVVEYQGAFEALSGGVPEPFTLTPWVSGTGIDLLDGRRFVRFRVRIAFAAPGPGGSTPTNVLPSVSLVELRFQTPTACP